jgi:hypothetical protein
VTKLEVAKLIGVLIASFPSTKATPETSAVYERMLADLDYPAANAAVERLLATAKFMPTIAEIREATLAVCAGEVRPGGEAWGAVLRATGSHGYVRPPGEGWEFTDPITAQCVKALGWKAICDSENQAADRARFIELYDKLAATGRRSQLSAGLPAQERLKALQAKQVAQLVESVTDSTRPEQ